MFPVRLSLVESAPAKDSLARTGPATQLRFARAAGACAHLKTALKAGLSWRGSVFCGFCDLLRQSLIGIIRAGLGWPQRNAECAKETRQPPAFPPAPDPNGGVPPSPRLRRTSRRPRPTSDRRPQRRAVGRNRRRLGVNTQKRRISGRSLRQSAKNVRTNPIRAVGKQEYERWRTIRALETVSYGRISPIRPLKTGAPEPANAI
jgi:hypothetical protein